MIFKIIENAILKIYLFLKQIQKFELKCLKV